MSNTDRLQPNDSNRFFARRNPAAFKIAEWQKIKHLITKPKEKPALENTSFNDARHVGHFRLTDDRGRLLDINMNFSGN